jgi:hypothetical protein
MQTPHGLKLCGVVAPSKFESMPAFESATVQRYHRSVLRPNAAIECLFHASRDYVLKG